MPAFPPELKELLVILPEIYPSILIPSTLALFKINLLPEMFINFSAAAGGFLIQMLYEPIDVISTLLIFKLLLLIEFIPAEVPIDA